MKYVNLGERGPRVSPIGFGAWAIGGMNWGKTDDALSKNAIRAAIENGVNFLDTADVYGFGHSEDLIREVLSESDDAEVIIASKAGNDFYNASSDDDKGYGPIRQNYEKDYLIEAAEKSIKRLGVQKIDILQLHSPDTDILKRDEPWLALERLKDDGKILHAGWSVQSFEESEQAFVLDDHHHLLDCIQVRYNLLEREAEKVLFPKAIEYGIGVIVRIPILFGFLSGKFGRNSKFNEDDHRHMNLSPAKLGEYMEQSKTLKPLFDEYPNESKVVTSLRFCISHPACHTAIPGAKTPLQVRENCQASDLGPIII